MYHQQHPVEYDEFGFIIDGELPDEASAHAVEAEEPTGPHIPIREQFPEAGSQHLGGSSDGYVYKTIFTSGKLIITYNMVLQFLKEEGYGDVPVPETAEDLRLFRKPRPGQMALFSERGYVHNPVKILFSTEKKQPNTLILCLYNEKAERHLLRFHGLT